MNTMNVKRHDKLPGALKLSLFCTSYLPLFIIIILKQITMSIEYLHWGGFSLSAISVFVSKFLVTFILLFLSLFGILGIIMFLKGMKKMTKNSGNEFIVLKVQNKNNESIGYIATYLFPFMFQSFSSIFEICSFFMLLIVVFIIYTHSTLLVVNPVLSIKYSLYDIDYSDKKAGENRQGTFIINCHYIENGDKIVAKSLGNNLFYSELKENQDE